MFGSTEIHWHLFTITVIAMALIPGIAMLFSISESVQNGVKYGLIAAIAVEVGTFTYLLISVVLLTTLYHLAHRIFDAIQILGALYLLYLGIQAFRHLKHAKISIQNHGKPKSGIKVFLKGYIINLLNPKIGLFFLAFLPQFIHTSGGSLIKPLFVLGLIFNLTGVIVNVLMALIFNQKLIQKITKSKLNQYAWVCNAIPGIIFLGLGIFTLLNTVT